MIAYGPVLEFNYSEIKQPGLNPFYISLPLSLGLLMFYPKQLAVNSSTPRPGSIDLLCCFGPVCNSAP